MLLLGFRLILEKEEDEGILGSEQFVSQDQCQLQYQIFIQQLYLEQFGPS